MNHNIHSLVNLMQAERSRQLTKFRFIKLIYFKNNNFRLLFKIKFAFYPPVRYQKKPQTQNPRFPVAGSGFEPLTSGL